MNGLTDSIRELVRDEVRNIFGALLQSGAPSRAQARTPARAPARKANSGDKVCAIVGCGRRDRSKGYCSAHYQKRRNMAKAGRLPKSWVDGAAPGSLADVKVPRGRAASKGRVLRIRMTPPA